ncbi:MAG: RNA-binding domain-containing protein [Candidatus Methanomethylicaceae archaeon]|nr:RNA-binding domain-containing protein [Candidatus Verstraetearchaeota archaeon]
MISSIFISAIVHATEDPNKVKTAMLNIIPSNLRSICEIQENYAKGHHGNPIIILNMNIRNSKIATEIFNYIINSFSKTYISLIKSNPNLYSDGNSIFLRLDKQAAYNGVIQLSFSDDVIKIKIVSSNPMEIISKL